MAVTVHVGWQVHTRQNLKFPQRDMQRVGTIYHILAIGRILGMQRWPGRARHALRHNRMPLFWLVVGGTFVLLWGQGTLSAF